MGANCSNRKSTAFRVCAACVDIPLWFWNVTPSSFCVLSIPTLTPLSFKLKGCSSEVPNSVYFVFCGFASMKFSSDQRAISSRPVCSTLLMASLFLCCAINVRSSVKNSCCSRGMSKSRLLSEFATMINIIGPSTVSCGTPRSNTIGCKSFCLTKKRPTILLSVAVYSSFLFRI